MTAVLGGFEVTQLKAIGLNSVRATISPAVADRYLQIYSGRRLVGVSEFAGASKVIGQIDPSHCPSPITIVMVAADERLTDFGPQLPPLPFNQFQIDWEADSFPADAKWFEVTACTEAEGAIDPENVLSRIAYIGDGSYRFTTPAITAPGEWSYRVTPLDDATPGGNAGTAADVAMDVIPYPPDVLSEDGQRLTAEVADGILTVGFQWNWEPA